MDVLQILLDNGADIEARENGLTPLHVACTNGSAEVAEVQRHCLHQPHSIPDNRLSNLVCVFQVLLEKGAEVDAKSFTGATPLHVAAMFGHPPVAKVVVK